MKIIIIGAGVSGLAAAAGLVTGGHDVEVYERAGRLRTGGNGVLIWHNGTGILQGLGISLDGLGRRIDTADVWSYQGVPLMRTDLSRIAAEFGSPGIGVMRGQVVERLAAALPAGALRLGKQAVGISYHATGGAARPPAGKAVTVEFADGTTAEGDVLIGADGYRSGVRVHLFGEDHARYTGLSSWHGTTAKPLDLGSEFSVPTFYGKRGLCTLHPVGNGLIHWSFELPFDNGQVFVPRPGEGLEPGSRAFAGKYDTRLEVLHDWFGGWTSPVSDLLSILTEEDIAEAPHTIHKVPKWWGRGPVTLTGDAAHAIPPRAGWGVNQALEDGWVLSRALNAVAREGQDPAPALRQYEDIRRGRARKVRGRAKMLRHGNNMLLMLRFTRDGLPSTKMLRANIKNCSNYLNQEYPGAGGERDSRSASPAGV